MVNSEKLCDVYASDLAKGGNAKGPGEEEVPEGGSPTDEQMLKERSTFPDVNTMYLDGIVGAVVVGGGAVVGFQALANIGASNVVLDDLLLPHPGQAAVLGPSLVPGTVVLPGALVDGDC